MITAFINQKGGVAKTTSTLNVAVALSEKGYKVLMLDFDPQASLTIASGLEPERIEKNMYHVIVEKENIENIILSISDNLHIAPSIIDLSVAELYMVSEMARESILKKALSKIQNYYDFIFIDCPPSLGLLTINALCASQNVVIPTATDYLAYRGLKLLLETIKKVKENLNENLNIAGVIATFYDSRTLHSKEVLEALGEEQKILGVIKKSVQVQDSIMSGKSIITYNPEHPIAKEYKNIASKIEKFL